jgi:hypothetical protein
MSVSKTQLIWEAAQKVTLGKLVPPQPLLEVVIDREQRFQDIWDLSGEVDFSFYSHPDYVYLLLNSWRVRSCTDIELLLREKIINEPKVVIDFHGGMGLTAMRLGMAFPDATVYSHSAVEQHRGWCRDIAADLGLTNVHPIDHLVPADLLIAQETMDIYAPLAGRMGMQAVRDELEDIAFKVLNPDAYTIITDRLAKLHAESGGVLKSIEQELTQKLVENGIKADVYGREKRPYSIFRKMERKLLSLGQLSDIFGFRVIVGTVDRPDGGFAVRVTVDGQEQAFDVRDIPRAKLAEIKAPKPTKPGKGPRPNRRLDEAAGTPTTTTTTTAGGPSASPRGER